MCSSTQSLPYFIPAEAWFKTAGYFFHLVSMTCEGEVEDLLLASGPVSESHYNKMVILKTGPWFTGRIAFSALATGSEIGNDLLEYGDLACLAYQMKRHQGHRPRATEKCTKSRSNRITPSIFSLLHPAACSPSLSRPVYKTGFRILTPAQRLWILSSPALSPTSKGDDLSG